MQSPPSTCGHAQWCAAGGVVSPVVFSFEKLLPGLNHNVGTHQGLVTGKATATDANLDKCVQCRQG